MTNLEYISHPCAVDSEFVIKALDITEALANLTYLISLDSGDPDKVRSYAGLVEERLHALEDLFRSAAWDI